ncbi:Hypothetical protein GLP15_1913 [Giardia lamblia P15]|uniref:Nuclear factor related to kappa-B-binding protein second winged helix domain-containing protein n=1 Tax=Giardia intestinalis (strain P15) TaxID=658858 RepID=E1F614_GIAIA|nr:Hypothetical protein GLP15_1913 [Giardia lamblia P15]
MPLSVSATQNLRHRVLVEHACLDAQLQELREVLGWSEGQACQSICSLSMKHVINSLHFSESVPFPFKLQDMILQNVTPSWLLEYTSVSGINQPIQLTEQSILKALGLTSMLGVTSSKSGVLRIPLHLPVKRLLKDPSATSIKTYPPPYHTINHSEALLTASLPSLDYTKASLPKMRRAHGFSSVPSPQHLEADSYWVQNLKDNILAIVETNSYTSPDNSEQPTPIFDSPHQAPSTDSSDVGPGQLTEVLKHSSLGLHKDMGYDLRPDCYHPVSFSAALKKVFLGSSSNAFQNTQRRKSHVATSPIFKTLLSKIEAIPILPPPEITALTHYLNADQVIVRSTKSTVVDGVIDTRTDLDQIQRTLQLGPPKGKDSMECELFSLQPMEPYDPVPFVLPEQALQTATLKRHGASESVCVSSLAVEKVNELQAINNVPLFFGSLKVTFLLGEKLARTSPILPIFSGLEGSFFATDAAVFPAIHMLVNTMEYKRPLSKAKLSQFTRMAVKRVFQTFTSVPSQLLTNQDPEKFILSFTSFEDKCELSGKSILTELYSGIRTIPASTVDAQRTGTVSSLLKLPGIQTTPENMPTAKAIASPAIQVLHLHTAAAEYSLNTTIPQLAGFLSTASVDQTADSLRTHPTICHFLVALLAHQKNDSYISSPYSHASNDPLFYMDETGVTRNLDESIGECSKIQGRKSALLPHILMAIRDTYTLVPNLLIPEGVPVTEAVLTALNYMTSPSTALIDELIPQCIQANQGKQLKFTATESLFDSAGGTPCHETGPQFHGYFDTLEPDVVQIGVLDPSKKSHKLPASLSNVEPPLKQSKASSNPRSDLLSSFVRANTLLQTATSIYPSTTGASSPAHLAHAILTNSCSKNIVVTANLFKQYRDSVDNTLIDDPLTDSLLTIAQNKTTINLIQRSYFENFAQYTITPIKLQGIQYAASDYFSFINDSSQHLRKADASLTSVLSAADNKGKATGEKSFGDVKLLLPMTEPTKAAILAITSPMLGEYRLLANTGALNPTFSANATYYGIDIAAINAIGYAVSYLLFLSSHEYKLLPKTSPDELMTPQASHLYVQTRINAVSRVRQDKNTTLSFIKEASFQYTNGETLAYRAQEKIRFYLLPNYPFVYVIRGHRVPVVPIQRSPTQRLPDIPANPSILPRTVSKVFVVRDALARLAGRFGTINDVSDTCCDSGFYFHQDDPKLTSAISTILDRLHQAFYDKETERKVCTYISAMKLWIYVHGKVELFYDPVLRKDNRYFDSYPHGLDNIYQRGK